MKPDWKILAELAVFLDLDPDEEDIDAAAFDRLGFPIRASATIRISCASSCLFSNVDARLARWSENGERMGWACSTTSRPPPPTRIPA
jgi:hypothetical protein